MSDVKFTSYKGECLGSIKVRVARALEVVGGTAEGYAKRLCPKKTGNLQNSIAHQMRGEDTVAVGTNVEYAPFVELGHNQEPGRYVAAIGKRLVASHVAAKPYLRPAVENHQNEYEAIIKQELHG